MKVPYRPRLEDCERAARDGEVLYAPHQMKTMLRLLLALLKVRSKCSKT